MKSYIEVELSELEDDILQAVKDLEGIDYLDRLSGDVYDEAKAYTIDYKRIIKAIARAIVQDVAEVQDYAISDEDYQATQRAKEESIEQDALDAIDELNKD